MKKMIKSLALLCVTIVLTLSAGEIIVRLAAPQQLIYQDAAFWRSDPKFGTSHFGSVNAKINAGEGLHHIVTDQDGYRINYTKESIADSQKPSLTILGIGDSFLEAVSVENEQTAPEVITRQLTRQYHRKVEAVNGGVSNWDPNQYYLQAIRSLELRKYDLGLTFIFIGNDCVDKIDTSGVIVSHNRSSGEAGGNRGGVRALYKKLIIGFIGPIKNTLEHHSHLYIFFKHMAYNFFSRLGRTTGYFPPVFKASRRNSPTWEITTRLCKLIDQTFARYNTPVVFVLLPPIYQTYPKLFNDYIRLLRINPDSMDIDQPNKIFAAAFARDSLTLVDPLLYLRLKASQGQKLYGTIDRHFNAAGHQAVAEYLYPYVETILHSKLEDRTVATIK